MVRNAADSVTEDVRSRTGTASADAIVGIPKVRVAGRDTRRGLVRTDAVVVTSRTWQPASGATIRKAPQLPVALPRGLSGC